MSQDLLYSAAGVALFGIGLFGLITSIHIIRKLIAVNIMGIGVFMVLLATAHHHAITDPVPHAMVLTGIVVAIAGTALCVWLALRIHQIDSQSTAGNSPQ